MQDPTDEQLIQSVAGGDTSCLATLFERHHKGVYQFCLQMTRNRTHSEDLVQDVFFRILSKARSFRGDGLFKGWMFNIARNITLDHLRKMKRQASEEISDEIMNEYLINNQSAELAAGSVQKLGRVTQALRTLPINAQEVIWLGRFEFDNYEDLGRALGCNAGAARVRMHRAMGLLSSAYNKMSGVSTDV
jgi:RNA polymerase sigma-70 factor (ECF subfamily)